MSSPAPLPPHDHKSNRRIFAIGDIHGCAQELEALILKMNVKRDDLVVFLGDYVDRGPDSRRVIDIILALSKLCEVVALKGNHEAMFLDFLKHPESPGAGLFVLNGGTTTLAKYSADDGAIEIPDTHIEFFENLKLFHETEDYFFVHAGVPNQPLSTINPKEHETHMLWTRYPFLGSEYKWEKLVIHGHTPASEVEVRANRVNLDTGCVYDGKLTALELPSGVFHQVEKGIKNEQPIFPREAEGARVSTRFSGRLPVEARLRDLVGNGVLPYAAYETLNYNQFGLLMREIQAGVGQAFQIGDAVEGRILPVGAPGETIEFVGSVTRTETRGTTVVYGVRIDRIHTNERGWVSRPTDLGGDQSDSSASPATPKK